jgi:hypothetical protein
MRVVIALVLLLIAAPHARAEGPVPEKEVRPTIAQTVTEADAPALPQLLLSEVELPAYSAAVDAPVTTQEMPRRGSFWWLVGVIVVAGVILAVLLD